MATRKIVVLGNDTLRKKSKPVLAFDESLVVLLDDMKTTMIERKGVGIAAVQVGVLRRAIIIELEEGEYLEIINPQILKTKGKVSDAEGCLSVPGFYCDVPRPRYVKIRAFDRNGNEFEFEAEDYLARCVCHEMDHLDGVLFVDLTEEGRKYKKENGVI
ncbi:MAG: peptide deformylase [Clostridia bacterium]|nr:peptide deformylase [Clostridia bacterium]